VSKLQNVVKRECIRTQSIGKCAQMKVNAKGVKVAVEVDTETYRGTILIGLKQLKKLLEKV